MQDDLPKLVIISGPTCSGKSSLGVELALKAGGEIINADSMQVYRGMDIGTAKIPVPERKGIPHHLIDVVDPDEEFNAALFRERALAIIKELHREKTPIFVVGGTGLYLKALLGGLFEAPPPDPALREKLVRQWEEVGPVVLYERLLKLDRPAAESINPMDKIRITRALEVMELTGCRFSELTKEHDFSDRRFNSLNLCLNVDRQTLYCRINRRTESMIAGGLVSEVQGLLHKGYSPELKPLKAIGYRHIVGYLTGQWHLVEAKRVMKRDTRRYAKRQLAWFRADSMVTWVEPDDRVGIVKRVRAFLGAGVS